MKIRPSHVALAALAALSLAACQKPAAPADNTAASADNSAMNAAANTTTNTTSSDNSAATNTGGSQ